MPEGLLSALMLWCALLVLLPKRDWRAWRARLSAAARGRRRHPFGPPAVSPIEGETSWLVALRAELPRCLELGVPLWVAGLIAERRGRAARQLALANWSTSPSGLMWSRVTGRIDDAELHRHLTAHGYPLPATKVQLRPRLDFRLLRPRSVTADRGIDGWGIEPGDHGFAWVQMVGRIRVGLAGRDLTGELSDRPVISYLVQYLLVRSVLEPGRPISRSVIADELYPGLAVDVQMGRLRRRLHDLQHRVSTLARLFLVTDHDVTVDLGACRIDAAEILRLAAVHRGCVGPLPDEDLTRLERAIAVAHAECLPDWEELQVSVNQGRGEAERYVANLRRQLVQARCAMIARLAAHYVARGDHERARPLLAQAKRLVSESE